MTPAKLYELAVARYVQLDVLSLTHPEFLCF
jgi:hypothetical protein